MALSRNPAHRGGSARVTNRGQRRLSYPRIADGDDATDPRFIDKRPGRPCIRFPVAQQANYGPWPASFVPPAHCMLGNREVGTTDPVRIGLGDRDQSLVPGGPAHVCAKRSTRGVRTQDHRGFHDRSLLRDGRLVTGDTHTTRSRIVHIASRPLQILIPDLTPVLTAPLARLHRPCRDDCRAKQNQRGHDQTSSPSHARFCGCDSCTTMVGDGRGPRQPADTTIAVGVNTVVSARVSGRSPCRRAQAVKHGTIGIAALAIQKSGNASTKAACTHDGCCYS